VIRSLCFLALALTVVPLSAQAHVRVFPDAGNTQAPACGFTKFIVRVPVEKPVATNRIDLTIPKGIVVYAVQPKPNWQFNLVTTHGVVTAIS
jgi:uncharacterized protein YcnI